MQTPKRKHVENEDNDSDKENGPKVCNSNISDHPDPFVMNEEKEKTKDATTKSKKKLKEKIIPDKIPSVDFYREQWCNLLRSLWGDQMISRLFKFPNVKETFVGGLEDTNFHNGFEFIVFELSTYIFSKLLDSEENLLVNNGQNKIQLTSLKGLKLIYFNYIYLSISFYRYSYFDT